MCVCVCRRVYNVVCINFAFVLPESPSNTTKQSNCVCVCVCVHACVRACVCKYVCECYVCVYISTIVLCPHTIKFYGWMACLSTQVALKLNYLNLNYYYYCVFVCRRVYNVVCINFAFVLPKSAHQHHKTVQLYNFAPGSAQLSLL